MQQIAGRAPLKQMAGRVPPGMAVTRSAKNGVQYAGRLWHGEWQENRGLMMQ